MDTQTELDLSLEQEDTLNVTPTRSYLTHKRHKTKHFIDSTNLEPDTSTMFAKSFRDAYYRQLHTTLFEQTTTGDLKQIHTRFYHISLLVEAFVNKFEVQIVTNSTSRYKREITATLNYFIRKNWNVLFGFYRVLIDQINVDRLVAEEQAESDEIVIVTEPPKKTSGELSDPDDVFG